VAGKKVLLLLDDAASHEQIRPLLPGTTGSLVLITSRRRLTALDDAAVISLDTLPPSEAAELLARLAGRAELASGAGQVGELVRLCGYLPLAIGMLARQLRHHPAWTVAGMAAELAAARDRLAMMHAENLSVAAAFDLSYRDLAATQQRLFRRAGLVPGPGFDAYAVAALDDTSLATARRGLADLYDHHLLAEPALAATSCTICCVSTPAPWPPAMTRPNQMPRQAGCWTTTCIPPWAAGRHFDTWASTFRRPLPGHPPPEAPDPSAFGQAAAWLEAERTNLHAAADYAAGRARFPHAFAIPAAMSGFLAVRGHSDQSAALHQGALAAARHAGDRLGEADTLSTLGALQRNTDDYPAAAASLAQALALYEEAGDQPGQIYTLGELGLVRAWTGDYPAAAASHQQALVLARRAGDRRGEAWTLVGLGLVQQLTGDHPAAAANHQHALALFGDVGDRLGQAYAFHVLGGVQLETGDHPAAAASQHRALALFGELGHPLGQASALDALGLVQQLTGDYPAAAANHQHALALFGDLGNLLGQAETLNGLGLVQQQTGDHPAAAANHQHALALFGDLGNLLGQAEALNGLGELSLRTSAAGQARGQHTQALAIARDISAAPEEARALEGIGNTHLREGNPSQAAAHLQQALTIYQRTGAAAAARRVQQTLQDHHLNSTCPEPRQWLPAAKAISPHTLAATHEAPHARPPGTRPVGSMQNNLFGGLYDQAKRMASAYVRRLGARLFDAHYIVGSCGRGQWHRGDRRTFA